LRIKVLLQKNGAAPSPLPLSRLPLVPKIGPRILKQPLQRAVLFENTASTFCQSGRTSAWRLPQAVREGTLDPFGACISAQLLPRKIAAISAAVADMQIVR
jgi:hypothetical protein